MDLKQKQLASVEQEVVLRVLAETVACPGCKFLEVGSWLGDSTVILARVAKANKGVLFCVDWWKGNIGTDLVDIASKADVFSVFWSRICKEGLEDVVVPIRSRSDLAAEIIKENSFNLVYLDADHRYEAVLSDVRRYIPLVNKEQGILCGHDCEGRLSDYEAGFLEKGKTVDYYESVHCGVVKAIGETFSDYLIVHSVWCVRFSSKKNIWVAPDIKFKEISDERQIISPPMAYSNKYALLRYGKFVYAIPRSSNPPDIKNEKDLMEFSVAVANSWQEMEGKIKEAVILWLELYKDFNILKLGKVFYALLDLADMAILLRGDKVALEGGLASHSIFAANTLLELKHLIDHCEFFDNKSRLPVPLLVEEGCEGYNIVQLGARFFAVLQSLGPINLGGPSADGLLKKYGEQGKCFSGNSLFEVKYLVNKSKNSVLQADIPSRDEVLRQDVSRRDETIAKLNADIQERNKKTEALQAELYTIKSKWWFRIFNREKK